MRALVLLLVLLSAPAFAQDVQTFQDAKIIVRAERLSRGWDICADAVSRLDIGVVQVWIDLMDSFGTVVDTPSVWLRLQRDRGLLCYTGPLSHKIRDPWKWRINNVAYQTREFAR